MKFKRIDTETVRCLISESELQENGLELDDFMNHKNKTEEFIRKIITMAEQEVDYKVQGGAISVQIAVLDDKTLALTMSEKQEKSILDVLDNLKSAVEVLADVTDESKKTLENLEKKKNEIKEKKTQKEVKDLVDKSKRLDRDLYELEFVCMNDFMRYCKCVYLDLPIENSLYKLESNGYYYLVLDKEPLNERELCKLLGAALDFSKEIYSDGRMKAYLDEHGICIIKEHAIQHIKALDEKKN